jgi:hypothetical protein
MRARPLLLLACGIVAGCGGGMRRFPLRDPLWEDGDRQAVRAKCDKRPSKDDPDHVACAPEIYVSPLAWDAADNSLFRPIAKVFAVDPPKEARNVNAFDEVPDSAWFTNRLGKKRPPIEELLRGACKVEDMLDPASAAPGAYVIDQGKPNGASPGFRVKIGGKKKYMFKTDFEKEPERPSAAAVIGTVVYHAVGFNTSCEQVLYADPSVLKLTPGLKVTANDGVTRPFDQAALDRLLAQAVKAPDGKVRFQASAWLGGYLLGPFKYEGTRKDDPNDVIPHEDRRDLRGGRLVAAWLHHFDAREQNSMDSWISADPKRPDSSPGWVRHYYLDTSDCLGSQWDWDRVSREMGDSFLLDWGHIGADFATFGILERPWERKRIVPGKEMFGYYHWEEFDPDGWVNEYPNPAFGRATEHDNAWMARILSRFDRADLKAIAQLGKWSNPDHADYLAEVLERRLQKIAERYLLNLSPIADLRVEADGTLCATDLARRRAVRPDEAFAYRATYAGQPLAVTVKPEGGLCLALPRATTRDGYLIVRIDNGASKGALLAHLYDLGPGKGHKLVGLERPDP